MKKPWRGINGERIVSLRLEVSSSNRDGSGQFMQIPRSNMGSWELTASPHFANGNCRGGYVWCIFVGVLRR